MCVCDCLPLAFTLALSRPVVAKETSQQGFLWSPRLQRLLLHQPQQAPCLICSHWPYLSNKRVHTHKMLFYLQSFRNNTTWIEITKNELKTALITVPIWSSLLICVPPKRAWWWQMLSVSLYSQCFLKYSVLLNISKSSVLYCMFSQYESVVTGLRVILASKNNVSRAFWVSEPSSSRFHNGIINLAFPYNRNGNKKEFMNTKSGGGKGIKK